MGTRRKGREGALQVLYQIDLSGVDPLRALELYWRTLASDRDGEDFTNLLIRGWAEQRDAVDERIRSVSEHWRLERMARVDRNILRLATYELLAVSDIPPRVTINEAVELAKRYGAEGSAGFVNGVLDRIASDLASSPE